MYNNLRIILVNFGSKNFSFVKDMVSGGFSLGGLEARPKRGAL